METNKTPQPSSITRRQALKYIGFGAAGVAVAAGGYVGIKRLQSNGGNGLVEEPDHNWMVATRPDPVTGANISLLAFGCMRFPLVEPGKPEIDEAQSMEMIDYAYKHGVNYFDTAWFYHQGLSELFVGKALSRYPRESYYIADKMPGRAVESLAHAQEIFETQLKKCQTDYFDFYLLHSVGKPEDYTRVYEQYGVLKYLLEEKAKGRIKRLGLSFHGDRKDFTWFLDKHKWDFVMIQANYFDWGGVGEDALQNNANKRGLGDGEYLYNEVEKRGMACMIMEPVRGGMLATLNPDARKVFNDADPKRSTASWAVQWIASKPNVLTVLSGMSNMAQVKDNVKTLAQGNFHPMTDQEYQTVNKAMVAFQRVKPVPCTECEYCMPCPADVNIPMVFKHYNQCVSDSNVPDLAAPRDKAFKQKRKAFLASQLGIDAKWRADRCTACNHCLPLCPQHIPITNKILEIAGLVKALK
ncbi:aldo/keto reductase [Bacteroidia bacterium]|nr:aldo/keto reductase [Bacteroidia bacterium]